MAQRIRFRLTAAKVGVSAALLALIGGAVEKLRGGQSEVRITPASAPGHFTLHHAWPSKYTSQVKVINKLDTALGALEQKWLKLDGSLADVTQQVAAQKKHIANIKYKVTVLKQGMSTQTTEIQKQGFDVRNLKQSVSTEQKVVSTLNADVLKLRGDVNKVFGAGFLTGTAARNEFVQGRGNVVSGAATVPEDLTLTPVVATPDGAIHVALKANSDLVSAHITNRTGVPLTALLEEGSTNPSSGGSTSSTRQVTLAPGPTDLGLGISPAAHQLHLQIFPANGFSDALTLTLSVEPDSTGQELQAVGQMLIGSL